MRIARKNIVAVARAQGCKTKPFSTVLVIERPGGVGVLMRPDGSFIGHDTLASVIALLRLDADRGTASWAAC